MKALAETQNWTALEDAWLEALASDHPDVNALLDVTEVVACHDRRRAVDLLSIMVSELFHAAHYAAIDAALRLAVRLAPGNAEVKGFVIRLLRERTADPRATARMIEFAGFEQRPLREAWDLYESLTRLQAGAYVLHDSWGPGRITECETATQEVAVDFAGRPGHRMSWSMALKALAPLAADHLLAMTVDRGAALAAMPPVELLGLAVRSLGGEADPKDVKRLVEPVVGAENWPGWWARARSETKDDPRLHVSLAKPMRIRWVDAHSESPPDALTELRSVPLPELTRLASRLAKDAATREGVSAVLLDRLPALRKHPPMLIEALLILTDSGDPDAPVTLQEFLSTTTESLETVLAVRSTDLRRQAMTLLEERGDPPSIRRELFLRSTNASDWEALARRMDETEKTELGWEVHRGLPARAAAYFWLVRKAEGGFPLPGSPLDRAIRLVGLLDEAPGLLGPVTSYVAEERMLQRAAEGSKDKSETLLAFLNEARLPVSLKDEIRVDVYARFPELRPVHELIYTTQEGLERREEELRHLVKVELPQNRAALAEAKAHGDLRENFEYKAAKEQQERILARMNEIQAELSRVRVLDPERIDTSAVAPGCRVTLYAQDGAPRSLVILGPWDSDPDRGVFSYRAPGVQPLMGRRTGETALLNLPLFEGAFRVSSIDPWTSRVSP